MTHCEHFKTNFPRLEGASQKFQTPPTKNSFRPNVFYCLSDYGKIIFSLLGGRGCLKSGKNLSPTFLICPDLPEGGPAHPCVAYQNVQHPTPS